MLLLRITRRLSAFFYVKIDDDYDMGGALLVVGGENDSLVEFRLGLAGKGVVMWS